MIDWMVFQFVDFLAVTGFSSNQFLATTAEAYETQVLVAEVCSEESVVAFDWSKLEHTSGRGEISVFDGRSCARFFFVQKRNSSGVGRCQHHGKYPVGAIRIPVRLNHLPLNCWAAVADNLELHDPHRIVRTL